MGIGAFEMGKSGRPISLFLPLCVTGAPYAPFPIFLSAT